MRLTEEELAAINDPPSWPEDIGTGSYRIAMDVLDRLLAREAEHTTLVTPEWLDGEEARRLGFERRQYGVEGFRQTDPAAAGRRNVCLREDGSFMWTYDRGDSIHTPNPTIAQVRAAVYLATGRR